MRRTSLTVLLVVLVGSALGCATESPPAARLGGLLVLAGDTSGGELRAWADGPQDADGAHVATPRATAWVMAGRADVLVAIVGEGSLRISDPIRPDRKASWSKPVAIGATGEPAEGPFYFPTWDPEGGRFAALSGDLDADPRLTLVDPTVGSALEIDLGRPVATAPPAWVGDDLVAVLTGTTDDPGSILIDTTTSEVSTGPRGARLIASSSDGMTVAIVADDGDAVTIRTTDAWLTGDGTAIGSVDPPADVITASAIALDARGERLAIAWLTDAGVIRIAVHDRAAGWRRVAEPSIGDSPAAVVAWRR